MNALERANAMRLRRAEIGREIRFAPSRPESAAAAIEVLREREEAVQTLAVTYLLQWVRGIGEEAARKACIRLQLSETRPLGALTERQVTVVENWLRARAHLA